VSGTSVGENALLIARGQRRKSTHYKRGLPKSISERTTCQTLKQICYSRRSCQYFQLRTGNWAYNSIRLIKTGQ